MEDITVSSQQFNLLSNCIRSLHRTSRGSQTRQVRKSHSIPDFQQKVRTETNTGEHIMLNMTQPGSSLPRLIQRPPREKLMEVICNSKPPLSFLIYNLLIN